MSSDNNLLNSSDDAAIRDEDDGQGEGEAPEEHVQNVRLRIGHTGLPVHRATVESDKNRKTFKEAWKEVKKRAAIYNWINVWMNQTSRTNRSFFFGDAKWMESTSSGVHWTARTDVGNTCLLSWKRKEIRVALIHCSYWWHLFKWKKRNQQSF